MKLFFCAVSLVFMFLSSQGISGATPENQQSQEHGSDRNHHGDCLAHCRDSYLDCIDGCRENHPGDPHCYDNCSSARDECDKACYESSSTGKVDKPDSPREEHFDQKNHINIKETGNL